MIPTRSTSGSTAACSLRAAFVVPESAMRRALIGERMERLPPEEAASLLDEVLRRAIAGAAGSQEAVVALALWIIEARAPTSLAADPGRPRRARAIAGVREAAAASGLEAVAAVLADGPAARAIGAHARLAEVCIDVEAPISIVPRSPAHAGPNLHRIERLRVHHDPRMIRRLLQEPWIRADDVCRIAARRPSSAAIALAIALAPRWMHLACVREALVENPFTPVSIAAPLVPTVGLAVLRRLGESGMVHPSVAAAVRALAGRRPVP
ncbi:MAG: hypothetical protein QM820_46420 [Minicystis sp.]